MIANLSFKLGESGTDSVFLRSFSALVLCGVFRADREFSQGKLDGRESFLSIKLYAEWLEKTLEYFIGEQDLRGYIPEKKWAHSIAHCGDLLRNFVIYPKVRKEDHLKILNAFVKKLTSPANQVFSADEDARILSAIVQIWMHNLVSIKEFDTWLEQIIKPYISISWHKKYLDKSAIHMQINARMNIRVFLETFYFMIFLGAKDIYTVENPNFKEVSETKKSLLNIITQKIRKMDDGYFFSTEDEM
jgi:hypothetical protein